MDPILNPFAPGAGTTPPALAGRDELVNKMVVALGRIRLGRPAKSILMVGLRGVGKTVLLGRIAAHARSQGAQVLSIEAPEQRSLPATLAPELRQVLLRLSLGDRSRDLAQRALRGLAGFVKSLQLRYADIELRLDVEPEPGLADSGALEPDLAQLLELVGEAAKAADSSIVLLIDELQYVPEEQLAALITALHRAAQRNLPVVLVGAGLPQLRGRTGRAKSYAERLFDYPTIGALPPDAARFAVEEPLRDNGVAIEPAALDQIVELTGGYPYFLQEWGKHAWDIAPHSPIRLVDVQHATVLAIAALDESFFRVRLDRVTPAERTYLRAMAELGPGPYRSGDIAKRLGRPVTKVSQMRQDLIDKGMIWAPKHGETAFTVPLFDEYLRRVL
ncbi:MAG: hypothetical protein RIT40_90 [Planctomycetota bacterium]|jgi:hypothetical protein